MRRSTGVTISAVVVIAGSAFTFFCGALMLLGSAVMSKTGQAPGVRVPVDIGSILIGEAIFVFAFAGWGLATGIGLLYLKPWGRISLLIFAGMLAFFSLFSIVFLAFIPIPNASNPNLPSNFTSIVRVGMGLFYGAFGVLGGFWLYFFNKRSVKAQFQTAQPIPETAAGDSFLGTPVPAPDASQGVRPLSITIIGWYLLISCALAPLGLLMNRSLFPGVRVPFYFLGAFLLGRSAYLAFIPWLAIQLVSAVGLLKLKTWGLYSAIALESLGALNGGLLMVIPGHRLKFQQLLETMMASISARMPGPQPFIFPTWLGLGMGLAMVFVILWFLITRRHAFTSGA